MGQGSAAGTPERALSPNTAVDARAAIAEMLLRAGAVEPSTLERCRRLMGKMGDEATLLGVLRRVAGIDEGVLLDCVRRTRPELPLGALLVELGLIGPVQLRQALQQQAQDGHRQRLGELLVERGLLRELDLTRVLAAQGGFESEEPRIEDCEPALLERVSVKASAQLGFLPIRAEGYETVVGFVDPTSQAARTEAARSLETGLKPVMMSRTTLKRALGALARRRAPRAAHLGSTDADSSSGRVNVLLSEALARGPSDIHIEPMRERVRVRLRVDGILREHAEFSRAEIDGIMSRLKIMAEADIAERRRHQDGRIAFEDPASGTVTDLRASFYVTVDGECAVLRVLNQNDRIIALDDVRMAPAVLERFKREALGSPTGVIVVTGPTGSGKTSTLYSCVDHLNDDTVSIITAEDPVEFRVDGISQCSLHPKIGLTFEESLRHVVRQDPDVIVLGEIRDETSAASAIQAALTGHKVLTTFHTEDSVGALLRLMNMNIEPFLLSSTLSAVLAQRLLRRVCARCTRPTPPDATDLQVVGWTRDVIGEADFREGEGCAECNFTGYRGRVAAFEVLVPTDAVREAVLERRTATALRRVCTESAGLVTLLEDGLVKAALGETTLAEVRRVLPRLVAPRPLQTLRRLTGHRR